MAKRIALTRLHHLSMGSTCRTGSVRSASRTRTQSVDVSGFNPTATDEFLQGTRAQTVSAEIFVGRGAGETQDILYPLYRDRTTFAFTWRATADAVSTTNPEWRGNAKMFGWSEGATRGEVETTPVTFRAADSTGIVLSYS
jgi:hypothetical protein